MKKRGEKLTRREALQKGLYYGRVAGAAGIYGTLGNIGGRFYDFGRNFINEVEAVTVKPTQKFYDKINWIITGKENPEKKEKGISRRDWLGNLFYFANKHPVGTGTTLGITYGAGKSGLRNYQMYKLKLRDIKSRLKEVENEKEREEMKKRIEALEQKIQNYETPNLEQLSSEGEPHIITGFALLVLSAVFGVMNSTGNVVAENATEMSFAGVIFFLTALVLFLVGVRRK